MIRFDNVCYRYRADQPPALDGLCFELEQGSFHFLTGPSGAGKTTVFRMLYLDILPDSGHISMFGKPLARLGAEEIAFTRRKLGIVFQDFRLLPHLTVRDNVALPLLISGRPTPEQQRAVDDMLAWVGLNHKKDARPDELSGGEKQRAGIARAVVHRPQLLIADEPTGNLDAAMAKRIMHLLVELNRHGTTVLVASHDTALVQSFNYPVLTMNQGRALKVLP